MWFSYCDTGQESHLKLISMVTVRVVPKNRVELFKGAFSFFSSIWGNSKLCKIWPYFKSIYYCHMTYDVVPCNAFRVVY